MYRYSLNQRHPTKVGPLVCTVRPVESVWILCSMMTDLCCLRESDLGGPEIGFGPATWVAGAPVSPRRISPGMHEEVNFYLNSPTQDPAN
jgi:hypothetical protein